MKKIISLVLLVLVLAGGMITLTGCNNKFDTNIEEISLYSGSSSVNNRYLLKNNELSVEMFRGGKKSEKKCTLTQEQVKNIEEIINKYSKGVQVDKEIDYDRVGASESYYSIKLKNDANVYNRFEGINELGKYFDELLKIE